MKPLDHRVQRYYDPGTGQFMSLDPLNMLTDSGYTFNKDNPFAYSDPGGKMYCDGQGYCGGAKGSAGSIAQPGGGTVPQESNLFLPTNGYTPPPGRPSSGCSICAAFNDVWHVIRTIRDLPESQIALEANLIGGADCSWTGHFADVVCSNSPLARVLDRPLTIGSVVSSPWKPGHVPPSYTCGYPGFLAHETKHSDQWAILGPAFVLFYFGNLAASYPLSWAFGGQPVHYQVLEQEANLQQGGYTQGGSCG